MDEQHPELACLVAQKEVDEAAKRANLVEELLAIGTALSGSHDLQQLLALILSKSREITCSDAGSVYLVNRKEDAKELIFKTAQNDSISTRLFQEFAIPLTPKSLAGYVALTGEFNQAIAYLKESLALIEDLKHPLAIETQELKTHYQTFEQQLQKIAQFTYRDVDGQQKPLLKPDEIAQLLVVRGNLTAQERLAIEAHVTHSYEFLKRIPWTKGLQDIPAIAYGHHEKLDGTGYPQGLHQQDIPMQTQMMSVADIYDALTAADRPYKRRLPIDIVMKILHEEADNGKINPDLVLLFKQRQVFTALGHTWPQESVSAA